MTSKKINKINKQDAKNIWIEAQKLNQENPFGAGASSVAKAVRHLGYVQIDTINVIERCHHHILYNRIPHYKRSYLQKAQSQDKTVFEYWTHALAYVPTDHFKYFVKRMNTVDTKKGTWFGAVKKQDYQKVISLLKQGPLSIRDVKDDELKDKEHEWDSRKPSKRALQLGFHRGDLVISKREGMLKVYDTTERHFGWSCKPDSVSETDYINYTIDRALLSQGLVSLDSICHLIPKLKKATEAQLAARVKRGELVEVVVEGSEKLIHWVRPKLLKAKTKESELTHILSPFDPLVIQRKRLKLFFDYEHIFEAYVPKVKRKYGYFSLPVLSGNEIIALLDLKTDRIESKLLIQNWVWRSGHKSAQKKKIIEAELGRFEKFQLSKD